MVFESGRDISYYLMVGWKIVSPSKIVCPFCESALIESKEYNFMYCTNCTKTVITEEKAKANGISYSPISPDDKLISETITAKLKKQKENEEQKSLLEQKSLNSYEAKQPVPDSNSDNKDEMYIGDIGTFMLKGCSMSSFSCGKCSVPLLRTLDKTTLFCAKCGFNKKSIDEPEFVDTKSLVQDIISRVNSSVKKFTRKCGMDNEDSESENEDKNLKSVSIKIDQKKNNECNPIEYDYQDSIKKICTNYENLISDLKEKIVDYAELMAEPCSIEEINTYSNAIEQVKKTIQTLRIIDSL